jgi:hypothetical protein
LPTPQTLFRNRLNRCLLFHPDGSSLPSGCLACFLRSITCLPSKSNSVIDSSSASPESLKQIPLAPLLLKGRDGGRPGSCPGSTAEDIFCFGMRVVDGLVAHDVGVDLTRLVVVLGFRIDIQQRQIHFSSEFLRYVPPL